ATEHYLAVADWLGAPGSPLAPSRPHIYPHGGMALETTVRPRKRDEFDLDLVCQVLPTGMTAVQVYNQVAARLESHSTYAPMLEKSDRCLRLRYAHDFCLDIISAVPDAPRGGTAILIPDRGLRSWVPSNPKGYVAWFSLRSRVTLTELRKKVDPVP